MLPRSGRLSKLTVQSPQQSEASPARHQRSFLHVSTTCHLGVIHAGHTAVQPASLRVNALPSLPSPSHHGACAAPRGDAECEATSTTTTTSSALLQHTSSLKYSPHTHESPAPQTQPAPPAAASARRNCTSRWYRTATQAVLQPVSCPQPASLLFQRDA